MRRKVTVIASALVTVAVVTVGIMWSTWYKPASTVKVATPVDPRPRSEQEADILEATLRRMLKDRSRDQTEYVQILDGRETRDPSEDFLNHLRQATNLEIKKGTERPDPLSLRGPDKQQERDRIGYLHTVGGITWVSPTEVVIKWRSHYGPLAATGGNCRVIWENGSWIVKSFNSEWVA